MKNSSVVTSSTFQLKRDYLGRMHDKLDIQMMDWVIDMQRVRVTCFTMSLIECTYWSRKST